MSFFAYAHGSDDELCLYPVKIPERSLSSKYVFVQKHYTVAYMDVDPYEEVTLHYTDYQSNGELLGGRTCICALCPERESQEIANLMYCITNLLTIV